MVCSGGGGLLWVRSTIGVVGSGVCGAGVWLEGCGGQAPLSPGGGSQGGVWAAVLLGSRPVGIARA